MSQNGVIYNKSLNPQWNCWLFKVISTCMVDWGDKMTPATARHLRQESEAKGGWDNDYGHTTVESHKNSKKLTMVEMPAEALPGELWGLLALEALPRDEPGPPTPCWSVFPGKSRPSLCLSQPAGLLSYSPWFVTPILCLSVCTEYVCMIVGVWKPCDKPWIWKHLIGHWVIVKPPILLQ